MGKKGSSPWFIRLVLGYAYPGFECYKTVEKIELILKNFASGIGNIVNELVFSAIRFIFTFLGLGVTFCVITCSGHVDAISAG
ncbi:tetraspanin-19-like isoform X2 [Sesbania bispinosa]|nr:tetraspanin-19-like isoform X2 [Sesbania bispinosa]